VDSFARDHLPPRDTWPDLLHADGPARLNAAVELLRHEGTAIAGGWSYAE
jgi:2-aminobenzoate-CoA ligase